jgi:hypothetical protein
MLKRLLLILALVAGQSAASQPLPVIEVARRRSAWPASSGLNTCARTALR